MACILRHETATEQVAYRMLETRARCIVSTSRRVLLLPLFALLFATSGARGQEPTVALDCGDLSIDVPAEIPSSDDGSSPVLLNGDTVNAVARSLYRIPWLRLATLEVLVQSDGRVSHACLDEASVDSAFDRVALKASASARIRPAGGATPMAPWTTLLVVAAARRFSVQDGRYLPIAFTDPLPLRFESEELLALQAAVLNYFVKHAKGHDRRGPNQGICVGIGQALPVLDPPASLMAHLQPASLPLRPASACVVDRQYARGWPSRLVIQRDGTPAIALWVDIAEPRGGVAQVSAGYYEGGLSGAHYACRVRKATDEWTVDACRVTAIS